MGVRGKAKGYTGKDMKKVGARPGRSPWRSPTSAAQLHSRRRLPPPQLVCTWGVHISKPIPPFLCTKSRTWRRFWPPGCTQRWSGRGRRSRTSCRRCRSAGVRTPRLLRILAAARLGGAPRRRRCRSIQLRKHRRALAARPAWFGAQVSHANRRCRAAPCSRRAPHCSTQRQHVFMDISVNGQVKGEIN